MQIDDSEPSLMPADLAKELKIAENTAVPRSNPRVKAIASLAVMIIAFATIAAWLFAYLSS